MLIEQYGPTGTRDYLAMDGDRPEFHPVFTDDLLPVFTGELARLEAQEASSP